MRTIFDTDTHAELVGRIDKLTADSEREWGSMSPAQMMEHTARALEMATGRTEVKQMFVGKAIGWIFKGGFLGDRPMPKGAPTGPALRIAGEPDLEATREKLKTVLNEFHMLGEKGTDGNIHGFFGRLTGKQWGETQYKHVDHHLRQFGV